MIEIDITLSNYSYSTFYLIWVLLKGLQCVFHSPFQAHLECTFLYSIHEYKAALLVSRVSIWWLYWGCWGSGSCPRTVLDVEGLGIDHLGSSCLGTKAGDLKERDWKKNAVKMTFRHMKQGIDDKQRWHDIRKNVALASWFSFFFTLKACRCGQKKGTYLRKPLNVLHRQSKLHMLFKTLRMTEIQRSKLSKCSCELHQVTRSHILRRAFFSTFLA